MKVKGGTEFKARSLPFIPYCLHRVTSVMNPFRVDRVYSDLHDPGVEVWDTYLVDEKTRTPRVLLGLMEISSY